MEDILLMGKSLWISKKGDGMSKQLLTILLILIALGFLLAFAINNWHKTSAVADTSTGLIKKLGSR